MLPLRGKQPHERVRESELAALVVRRQALTPPRGVEDAAPTKPRFNIFSKSIQSLPFDKILIKGDFC